MDLEKSKLSAQSTLIEIFQSNPQALAVVLEHSRAVLVFALKIGQTFSPFNPKSKHQCDLELLVSGALLHDCGIISTNAPGIYCTGTAPYLQHGIIGEELLDARGLTKEARICATHVGVGITAEQIAEKNLPLPLRDFSPTTLEEEIIAYADCFFSKRKGQLSTQKPLEQVQKEIARYGDEATDLFNQWHKKFGL